MGLSSILYLLTASLAAGTFIRRDNQPIFDAIDAQDESLSLLSRQIYENPEYGFEEEYAHEILTDFLEEQGFDVTRSAFNLSTSFVAEYSNGDGKSVSFNSEYDALPGLGHACGHNLIAVSGVAAALGVKEALENQGVIGRVVLYGTPAEEHGGGKIRMLEAGAYEDVDCSLMAHPSSRYSTFFYSLASWGADVSWHGAPAHAASGPWFGRNAMDGYVSAYAMAGLMRQQLQERDRIHHVVNEDSQVINIIPEIARSTWMVRALDRTRRDHVLERVLNIIEASALGTNTTVEVADPHVDYWDTLTNAPLAQVYYDHLVENFDPSGNNATAVFAFDTVEEEIDEHSTGGSTDQGNVSWMLPALHVMFPIVSGVAGHTAEFQVAAGTDFAYSQAIKTAKTLALVGIDVLRNETLFESMNEYFDSMDV